MDLENVLKGMAEKLVEDMDSEKAKGVLLAVVAGGDVYEAILGGVPEPSKPKRKKDGGRPRGRKPKVQATGEEMSDES